MKIKSERKRIKEILSVFLKYGMKSGIKTITNPAQARAALEELGPTFVKIGQILSMRPDIVAEPYISEFQKLQDNVRPEKFEDIKEIVKKELGGPIEKIFLTFDKNPVASASLAQVYTATLKNNEKVVVKVQRPRVKQTMLSDIALLRRLAVLMKFTFPGSVLNPVEIVDELWAAAQKELDFMNEAENITRFYENNKEVKYVTCPKVYSEYTTPNVLVMECIDGTKIINADTLDSKKYDFKDIAVKLVNNYFKQIFEDGFFHADPHPGNILLSDDKIVYIDFGMVGVLSKSVRDKINAFLYGAATRDIDAMTQAILKIGIKRGSIDKRKLYSDIEQIYNDYIEESLYEMNIPQIMDEIFKACKKNNISIPRDLTMLVKGVMTIEGVVAKLAPEMNAMEVAVPYVKTQMLKQRDYKQDMTEQLENLYTLSKYGLKIPIKVLELINSAIAGKLKVQVEYTDIRDSVTELNRMTNRIVFGLIVCSMIIASSLLINANAGPQILNMSLFGFIGYISAAVLAFWLLISILKSGKI